MGCSASKLDDEEAVQICRDRKNFIKQAVEQRLRFASGHVAYIKSLRRVSLALRNYVDADEHHHGFFSDSSMTPPFTPVKKLTPEVLAVHLKTVTPPKKQPERSTTHVFNYLRSGGEPSIAVEEWPGSPDNVRVESYYPTDHYGIDGFFATQASPMQSSFSSSPQNRPSYPPPSPQASGWDFFWNPFSTWDPYGYSSRDSLDQIEREDEMTRLRQVREEEGIPELEEDGEEEEKEVEEFREVEVKDEMPKVKVAVVNEGPVVGNGDTEKVQSIKEVKTQGVEGVEVSEARNAVELEVTNAEAVVGIREGGEETPGFTVYVNRKPTSISEVIRDVDFQFTRICDTAHEVSVMLEASRAQHPSASRELSPIKMLNPIALFRSPSSRSSSSRFLQASSSSHDDGYESSTDFSEDSCMISGSHQSTLERLYAWEKKLYEEVKCGERIRIAYEKKCMQLRNHDVNGEEPSVVDRTRAAVRDLRTQLQVSIHAVESVSRRIETLRDEELHPQLMELIQGLARMWRTIADCHRIQKRTIDEAKLLLFSSSSSSAASKLLEPSPHRPPRYAANLEAELRHWRSCLEAWVEAQLSYAAALAGWISRCGRPQRDSVGDRPNRSPLSPDRTAGSEPPVYRVCVLWARLLESLNAARAVEGVDFFAAGIGSVYVQQKEEAAATPEERVAMAPERVAEVAEKVLCAGMSVAIGGLAEFALGSAEGYEALRKRWEDDGGNRVEGTAEK